MDAFHRVIVDDLRRDALLRGRQRHAHVVLAPGERFHTPFLSKTAVVIERLVVAFAHHDVGQGKARRTEQPLVRLEETLGRNLALGDLDCPVDDVRTKNAVHQHVATLHRWQTRELPEASVQQRKRGHGMVARGHRQHPPLGPTLEILLRHHQNARMLRQVHLDATLEDVGVVPDVPRLELAFATHRDRLHGPRTLDARLPDSCKECADGVHARES